MTHHSICPEMGQALPQDTQIEYKCSYNSGFYITTALDLKGMGIRLNGDGSDHARGLKTYQVTQKAMDKLKSQYVCTYIELL